MIARFRRWCRYRRAYRVRLGALERQGYQVRDADLARAREQARQDVYP